MKKRLNQKRLEIISKGYANKTNVAAFLKIGLIKAEKIFNNEKLAAEKEGKLVLLGIDPKRLLKYINLSVEEIKEFAELEKAAEQSQRQ